MIDSYADRKTIIYKTHDRNLNSDTGSFLIQRDEEILFPQFLSLLSPSLLILVQFSFRRIIAFKRYFLQVKYRR